MTNKPKLNIKEQIAFLKNQGVTFRYFTEAEAEIFLRESNYFFQIKAFTKNYDKDENSKYKNLDFAYLRELSIIDTSLRDIILELCLTYEHLLKVHINAHCSENPNEDGYEIVENFLNNITKKSQVPRYYKRGKSNIYQKDLIEKYYIKKKNGTYTSDFALWNFVGILSFGEFMQFYSFYFRQYNSSKPNCVKSGFIEPIRRLRNAAAHNCCILHILKGNPNISFKKNKRLKTKIRQMCIFSTNNKLKHLSHPLIHDFICLLLATKELCPPKMFKKLKEKIFIAINKMLKHKEYFVGNELFESKFIFVIKIILKLYKA